MARLAQGWAGHPCSRAECGTLHREHPVRSLTRCAWSRAGRIGNARAASHRLLLYEDALPVVPQPIEEDPVRSAVPSGIADRSPEAPIPRSTRKVGLSNGKRPCRTASGPRWLMSQWPNSTGARAGSGRYAVQHNSRVHGHKALRSRTVQIQRTVVTAGSAVRLLRHKATGPQAEPRGRRTRGKFDRPRRGCMGGPFVR